MSASENGTSSRLGVAIVGLGGAVATTAVAGTEMMRAGLADTQGLPLAVLDDELTAGLVPYDDLAYGGWDFDATDLAEAAETHAVLPPRQLEQVASSLSNLHPRPGVANERFCRNVSGSHCVAASSHKEIVETIRNDLRSFRSELRADRLVMVNLASTEAVINPLADVFADLSAFKAGIENNHEAIGPAVLYAYAAILEDVPYVNFTPSLAADVPALIQLAEERGVPVAGKDGKTGQTFLKTVLAPGFRDRNLKVEGWFSTNILGNRDGVALQNESSLASKIDTKRSVLNQILGYPVEDHLVNINYYQPRGDNKEAWDNIDLIGFLGQKMQMKVNFLCRDSILAAPLVIELIRLADLAHRSGEGGVQNQLGLFFKLPMTKGDAEPEHDLFRQQQALVNWLDTHRSVPVSERSS